MLSRTLKPDMGTHTSHHLGGGGKRIRSLRATLVIQNPASEKQRKKNRAQVMGWTRAPEKGGGGTG